MDDDSLAKLWQEAQEAPLREQILVPAALYGIFGAFLVALLAAPVVLFQALGWLRTGVWTTLNLRTHFHLPSAETGWIGLNMILNRVAEGELAAAILIVAAVLFCLSLVAGWIATVGAKSK